MTMAEIREKYGALDNEELLDELVWVLGKGQDASIPEKRAAIGIKRLILERMEGKENVEH